MKQFIKFFSITIIITTMTLHASADSRKRKREEAISSSSTTFHYKPLTSSSFIQERLRKAEQDRLTQLRNAQKKQTAGQPLSTEEQRLLRQDKDQQAQFDQTLKKMKALALFFATRSVNYAPEELLSFEEQDKIILSIVRENLPFLLKDTKLDCDYIQPPQILTAYQLSPDKKHCQIEFKYQSSQVVFDPYVASESHKQICKEIFKKILIPVPESSKQLSLSEKQTSARSSSYSSSSDSQTLAPPQPKSQLNDSGITARSN